MCYVLSKMRISGTVFVFFQAEDGIRDLVRSRGLGDVYKRQVASTALSAAQFIGQSLSTQVNLDRLQARGQTVMTQQPIDIRTQVWFNPGPVSYTHLTLPTSDLV